VGRTDGGGCASLFRHQQVFRVGHRAHPSAAASSFAPPDQDGPLPLAARRGELCSTREDQAGGAGGPLATICRLGQDIRIRAPARDRELGRQHPDRGRGAPPGGTAVHGDGPRGAHGLGVHGRDRRGHGGGLLPALPVDVAGHGAGAAEALAGDGQGPGLLPDKTADRVGLPDHHHGWRRELRQRAVSLARALSRVHPAGDSGAYRLDP